MGDSKETLFDKFDILECLKKDVGAAVYLANHIYLGKKILLKTLDRDNIPDPAMLSRFQREAKTLAKLDHPNIIKVLDFGTHERFFYISFEFFESRNLRDVIASGDLSGDDKKNVLLQLFRGLEYAHARHVIHRDIKPENILLGEDNMLKIADFGLAQIHGEESFTQQTTIVGTPSYMSPEQISGKELTAQSDLFSAGVVSYELMTGANPFLGNDVGATLNNIFAKNVVLDETQCDDPSIRELINLALKKNIKDRLSSAQQVLTRLGNGSTVTTNIVQKESAKKRRRGTLIGTISLFILTGIVFLWMTNQRKAEPILEPLDQKVIDSTAISAPSDSMLNEQATESQEPSVRENEEQGLIQHDKEEPEKVAAPGRLHINCLPWAHVYIDNDSVNTTPLEEAMMLPPGDYAVRLVHPSYPAYMQNIRIEPEKDYYINATLYGYLSCNIYPWGDVFVDGEAKGQTPFADALIIAPGEHLLVVKNQQYGEIETQIGIAAGDTFFFDLNFEQQVENAKP